MSVSLLEVIEAGGYDIFDSKDDALWLLSKQSEFDELIEQAEEVAAKCDHENTSVEIIENTAEYELNQAQGNSGFNLTQSRMTVCDDCGTILEGSDD